jgi:hypothetical protein
MAIQPIDLFDVDERRPSPLADAVLILFVLRDDRIVVPVYCECL